MSTSDIVRKKLEELLLAEVKARTAYEACLQNVEDEFLRSRLTRLRDDEQKHIGIVQSIISLVINAST